MTILEAIAAEIEPYSLTDDSLEKAFIDSNGRFGSEEFEDCSCLTYSFGWKKVVAFAAMLCLNRLIVLANENIGGISQSYDVRKLEKRIAAIASENDLSTDLLLSDGDAPKVSYVAVM